MQLHLDVHTEIVVDNFAGGGGASHGIERAIGRRIDVAINHDPEAIAMHRANHPETEHYCESVWDVDPRAVKADRPIGLLWLSPDCKHFSKAKGGKPVEKKIRALAWIALRWAAIRQPRVIMLENVEEFTTWGPLTEGADGKLRPCPKRKGREFNAFRNALARQGYKVEHRELRACDFGAPTIRKRLFLIARLDGQPIVWPSATHGDPRSEAVKAGKLKPWRTAAECIDWSLDCPSIFLTNEEGRAIGVKRPLAEATMRRIAKGVMRYVINSAEPFIVPLTHHGADRAYGMSDRLPTVTAAHRGELALVTPFLTEHANGSKQRNFAADDPLRTQCAQVKGGHFAMVAPFLTKYHGESAGSGGDQPFPTITANSYDKRPGGNPPLAIIAPYLIPRYGEREGQQPRTRTVEAPAPVIVPTGNGASLVSAFLAKHYGGVVGQDVRKSIGTVTSVDHHSLVTSNLVKLRGGGNIGQATPEPLRTVSAGGTHFAEVRAFLVKYYGTDQDPRLEEPLHTVTTKDRYGLVTVAGEQYAIADIGLRMLAPPELFKAQGFPAGYIIEWGIGENGQRIKFSKSSQVRMVGNSVSPPLAQALVAANLPELAITKRRVA